MGKTIELAGIVIEAFLNNYVKQVLWVVPNNDLIDAAIAEVKKMCKTTNCRRLKEQNEEEFSEEIVFLTYNSLTSEPTQNLLHLWLGDDFQGMVRP